jgi:phosphatidylserine/phosphatidylglycerophosphate/cardiolipin synthase-like enzyme
MKRSCLAICISAALILISSYAYPTDMILNDTPVKVLFSPGGGCTKAIVEEINNAKTEILVQAYRFTSHPIAEALVEAHKRGVAVKVIIDEHNCTSQGAQATFLANQKILVYDDTGQPMAHNKVIIIDETTVITGSMNFTRQAEKNAENLLIIRSKELAKLYSDNWSWHGQDSEEFTPHQ